MKVLGKEHPQRIIILNDIAAVQIVRGNLKDAEKTLTEANKI
jgi:Flp pilus assembly protein TadD